MSVPHPTHSRPVVAWIFLWLSVLLLSACGSPLLKANFDDMPLGGAPLPEPPGPPVDDVVYLSDPGSGSATIVAAPAGLSGRSLVYRHVAPFQSSRFLGFGGKEVSANARQYWAIWNAIPALTPNVPLDIWIGDAHFGTMGKIRLLNDQVLVATNADGTAFSPIGSFLQGRLHTVVMKVDKPSATYQIWVIGGQTTLTTGSRAVLTPATLSTLRPYVYLFFSSNGTSASAYTVDNVLITQACPREQGVGVCE